MKTDFSYKKTYRLPYKPYAFLITASELRYTEVVLKDDDNTEEDNSYIGHYLTNPFALTPQKEKQIEYKNVQKTNKEFSIFVNNEFDIDFKIDGKELNEYRVYVTKKNKKTQTIDSFLCLIDCATVESLLNLF